MARFKPVWLIPPIVAAAASLSWLASACILIPELNQLPTVAFTATPRPDAVTVDFSSTSKDPDPDGQLIELVWDFGDGSPPEKRDPRVTNTAFHKFPRAEEYTVTLTVTDDNRQSRSLSQPLLIGPNLPPSATFTAEPRVFSVPPAVKVTFNALGSQDPEGGRLVYDWTFGDGGNDSNAGFSVSHTYTEAGVVAVSGVAPGATTDVFVTLTVTDPAGRRASTQEILRVTRSAPPSPTP